ncbi:MAG: O-antigen ligase family protein [Pseudomonadota bacterium]
MTIDRVLYGTLLCLVFTLPLLWGGNRNPVWLAYAALTFGMIALAALCVGVEQWRLCWQRYRVALLLLAAWLAANLLQLIPWPGGAISQDVFTSSVTTVQSFFYAGLFLLAALLLTRPSRLRWLAMAMLLAGFAQAMFGSLMTLSGVEWLLLEPKRYGIGYATGTFVNRNHYAGLLVTCLALGVGLLLGQAGSRRSGQGFSRRARDLLRWMLGPAMRLRLMLVVMVIGLVLSRSRMGNGAFFAALLLTALLALIVIRPMPKKILVLLSTLLIIDIALVGSWFGFEQVVERLQGTGQYDSLARVSADSDRLNISAETWRAAKDFLWLGSGGGTFEQIFPAYRPVDLRKFFDHAHNDYLEFLLEYGVIGLLPLGGWIVGAWIAAFRAMRERRNRLMKGLGFSVVMAMLAGAMQGTVDFNLHIPACAAYFTLVLALGYAALYIPTVSGKTVKI